MESVKNLLRKTALYKVVKRYRVFKTGNIWTKHDQRSLDFYSRFISPGDLVFDVGAHIGNKSKIFLKLGANVIAVEPQDECIRYLESNFGYQNGLTIIKKVLGDSECKAELMLNKVNLLSSLSLEWIEAVKSSGRFNDFVWDNKKIVSMTTLDRLINVYGIPDFIKIDVEGFEYKVIMGLSRPIKYISIEFTPELIESTYRCINKIQSIGSFLFNYTIYDNMEFVLEDFTTDKEIIKILDGHSNDNHLYGDIYCKFKT